MYQLTVLYGKPDDPAAFDKHYATTHAPLASTIPGVVSYTYGKAEPGDGDPAYYLVANLLFESQEALQAGMGSPAGQAAAGDLANFATGGATMLFTDLTEAALP